MRAHGEREGRLLRLKERALASVILAAGLFGLCAPACNEGSARADREAAASAQSAASAEPPASHC